MKRRQFILATLALASFAHAANEPLPREEKNLSFRNELRDSMNRGTAFLLTQQNADGSFGKDNTHPALSALPLIALLREPTGKYATSDAVKKGAAYLRKFAQPDGGIYDKEGGLANYNTSVCLLALALVGDEKDTTLLRAARAYVIGQQASGMAKPETDGGIGYGTIGASPKRGHPDLDAQLAQTCSKSVCRPGGSPCFLVILKKKDPQKTRSCFSRTASQTSRPLAKQAIPQLLPEVSTALQLLKVALKNLGVHLHIRCLQSRMDERKADGSCFMHGKASEFRIHRVGTKGVKTYVPRQVDPRNDAKHVLGPEGQGPAVIPGIQFFGIGAPKTSLPIRPFFPGKHLPAPPLPVLQQREQFFFPVEMLPGPFPRRPPPRMVIAGKSVAFRSRPVPGIVIVVATDRPDPRMIPVLFQKLRGETKKRVVRNRVILEDDGFSSLFKDPVQPSGNTKVRSNIGFSFKDFPLAGPVDRLSKNLS
jgi:hypothetical protein